MFGVLLHVPALSPGHLFHSENVHFQQRGILRSFVRKPTPTPTRQDRRPTRQQAGQDVPRRAPGGGEARPLSDRAARVRRPRAVPSSDPQDGDRRPHDEVHGVGGEGAGNADRGDAAVHQGLRTHDPRRVRESRRDRELGPGVREEEVQHDHGRGLLSPRFAGEDVVPPRRDRGPRLPPADGAGLAREGERRARDRGRRQQPEEVRSGDGPEADGVVRGAFDHGAERGVHAAGERGPSELQVRERAGEGSHGDGERVRRVGARAPPGEEIRSPLVDGETPGRRS
ncbi:hypothetical protein ACHAWF_009398 [Thalassiosira exigua]